MPLFRRLEGSPGDLRLTLEIKVIDDQIAECTEQMERKNAKAGARPESPTTEEKQGPHQASPPASC